MGTSPDLPVSFTKGSNFCDFLFAPMVDKTFHIKGIYSQTCLKGSPKGRNKSGCLRLVTPDTGAFALYFGSRDPEKVVN